MPRKLWKLPQRPLARAIRLVTVYGAAVAMSSNALAQTEAGNGPSQPVLEEIIVTGTLIRGVAPTGMDVIGLSSQDIVITGANRITDVLAEVPQITTNFNKIQTVTSAEGGISALRPDIRNLTGVSGASTTLVMMDGHRMVGVGNTSGPDPDVIPPALIERVEIVPDGGSSLYGADAVAGVINFITKTRFDGFEASGSYGVADDYSAYDFDLAGGKEWGSGSAFAAYNYSKRDAIYNRDRDYVVETTNNLGYCSQGSIYSNAALSGGSQALLSPNPLIPCGTLDDSTMIPEEERHSLFLGYNQDISDTVTFDIRGFYSERDFMGKYDLNSPEGGSGAQTVTLCDPMLELLAPGTCSLGGGVVYPGYSSVGGELAHDVRFAFDGVQSNDLPNELTQYQIIPTLTVDLGAAWELRALASYGESEVESYSPAFDSDAVRSAIAAGTLNPYDVHSSDPDVLAGVLRDFYAATEQEQSMFRLTADGPVAELPGGEIKVAVGAEHRRETTDGTFGAIRPGQESQAPFRSGKRDISSVYGEIIVPIVSHRNAMRGVESLTLSVSGRYDDYSDVGSTSNPKVGITYEPLDWLSLRASWGESFTAPGLSDLHAPDSRVVVVGNSDVAFLDPTLSNPIPTYMRQTVALVGGNPDLEPQTAETYSFGFNIAPPAIEGLELSATYYKVEIENQFNMVAGVMGHLFNPALSHFVMRNPQYSDIEHLVEGLPVQGPDLASVFAAGPAYYIDLRRNNLGEVKQDGFDFNVSYNRSTDLGLVYGSFGGTYILNREVAAFKGAEFIDDLDADLSRYSLAASVGLTRDNISGAVSIRHLHGYDLGTPVAGTAGRLQSSVDSFNTVDLFLAYDVNGSGWSEDLTFTLNVDNVLDEDPPFYNSDNGYTNGSTLGRLIQLGVRKRF